MLHNFVYAPSRKFENCQKYMIYLLIISYLKIHLYTVVTGDVMYLNGQLYSWMFEWFFLM